MSPLNKQILIIHTLADPAKDNMTFLPRNLPSVPLLSRDKTKRRFNRKAKVASVLGTSQQTDGHSTITTVNTIDDEEDKKMYNQNTDDNARDVQGRTKRELEKQSIGDLYQWQELKIDYGRYEKKMSTKEELEKQSIGRYLPTLQWQELEIGYRKLEGRI